MFVYIHISLDLYANVVSRTFFHLSKHAFRDTIFRSGDYHLLYVPCQLKTEVKVIIRKTDLDVGFRFF